MEEPHNLNNADNTIEERPRSTTYQANDTDPGAARQGNFINYYQFNPPSERLLLLFPDKLFNQLEITTKDDSLVCLDVGCNSGVSKTFQTTCFAYSY